jgi:RNA polymerase sigma-70 factor (ECF subfamily)
MPDYLSELNSLRSLDSQVVSAIYDRYFPDIFRYIRYRLGDETLAEDLASDVFVHLLEAVHAGRGPRENLNGWLIGTASHLATDHLRRRYRRHQNPLEDDHPSGVPAPAEEVESRENNNLVRSAISRLTVEQQHVITLRFGQGFSLEETASIMNKKVNTVKALQFRALAALQRKIGGQHE